MYLKCEFRIPFLDFYSCWLINATLLLELFMTVFSEFSHLEKIKLYYDTILIFEMKDTRFLLARSDDCT